MLDVTFNASGPNQTNKIQTRSNGDAFAYLPYLSRLVFCLQPFYPAAYVPYPFLTNPIITDDTF